MPLIDTSRLPRTTASSQATGEQYADQLDLSGVAGLTGLRAQLEELLPHTASSAPHWHSHRDELVYVLAGRPTLVEGSEETTLAPGDLAALPAGEPLHQLRNDTDQLVRVLVVASVPAHDEVAYR